MATFLSAFFALLLEFEEGRISLGIKGQRDRLVGQFRIEERGQGQGDGQARIVEASLQVQGLPWLPL